MPVRDMTERKLSPVAGELKKAIVQEWRNPTERPDEPIVLIDKTAPGGAKHVFVVWDRWGSLEQLERSETIMDACEEVLGLDESYTVTVAMGLTKAEAKRLNIQYE